MRIVVMLLAFFLFLLASQIQLKLAYSASIADTGPIYVGIAEFYDNRKAALTVTFDDWNGTGKSYDDGLTMFVQKHIYLTAGIITGSANWTHIQYWLDQGYLEAGSHSRTHRSIPYPDDDFEVGGSQKDITGNLTLPSVYSFDGKEYVYTWIEPYGQYDFSVRRKLGCYHYLTDRNTTHNVTEWALWDSTYGLYKPTGVTVAMGSPPSSSNAVGGSEYASILETEFQRVYNDGGIYHLMFHPTWVNWTAHEYADVVTDYIKDRPDVWYVGLGPLYLYHWMATRNAVQVSWENFGEDRIFKTSLSLTHRQNYGARYPVTYVFNIPGYWTRGYVYYRYKETDPWALMDLKSSEDLFNGINASRFDFFNHKAYVSVGFGESASEISLRLRSTPLDVSPPVADAGPDQTVEEDRLVTLNGSNSADDIGIITYTWAFVDVVPQTLMGVIPSYVFVTPGTYVITLNVTDASRKWAIDTVTVAVLDVTEPVANAGGNQTVQVGETVTFDASTSSDNSGISDYKWDFGDGKTGMGVVAMHAYDQVGTYVVTLTVKDFAGNTRADTVFVAVLAHREALPLSEIGITVLLLAGITIGLAGVLRQKAKPVRQSTYQTLPRAEFMAFCFANFRNDFCHMCSGRISVSSLQYAHVPNSVSCRIPCNRSSHNSKVQVYLQVNPLAS